MSRTFKSVVVAIAFAMCIGVSASAAEYCSGANFLSDVQAYFSSSDPLPGAIPARPAEQVKVESEKYVTLGELDLSTIKNVLRRTAPLPSGLPSNDDAAVVAAPVSYAAPIAYEVAPVVSYPVVYETAPVVSYPVVYESAPVVSYPVVSGGLVSTSTNTNCSTCRNRR